MSASGFLPFLQQYLQQPQGPTAPAMPAVPPSAPPADLSQQSAPQMPQLAPGVTLPPQQPPPAPEETKGHQLLKLLKGGLVGGLSGLAANAQTYAQTGRNAGIGGGIGAGFTQALPMQAAMQQAELGQKQAQTELTKQQATMVQTPYGPLPMALAKVIFGPAIKAESAKEVQGMKGQTAENIANTQAQTQEKVHRYMPIPGVGMFDTQSRQVMPGTEQGITITPEIAADHNLPQEFIGKPMKISDLNGMMRFENQQQAPMMTAQGPVVVDKKNATARPVKGPGGQSYEPPALASTVEVGDQNNPGNTIRVRQDQAPGMPGTQSASVTAPKKTLEQFTSGGYSQKLNSIATAREHMKTFNSLAKELDNGSVQALNALKNAIGVQFGDDSVTNFNLAKQFFSGEVGQAVVNGGGTAEERDKLANAIQTKSSWTQLAGALTTADALLKGKQVALTDTFEKGMQGQPNFGTQQPKTQPTKKTGSGSSSVDDLVKKYGGR